MAHTVMTAKKKAPGGKSGKKGLSRAAEMHVRRVGNKFISQTMAPQGSNPGEYQKPAEDIHDSLADLHDHMNNTFGEGGQDTSEPTTDADNE